MAKADRTVEPHAVVLHRACPLCSVPTTLAVVAIPKVKTGEFFAQFALCEACGAKIEFRGEKRMVVHEAEARYELPTKGDETENQDS